MAVAPAAPPGRAWSSHSEGKVATPLLATIRLSSATPRLPAARGKGTGPAVLIRGVSPSHSVVPSA